MRDPESLDLVARGLRKSRVWSRVEGQVWGGTQWCLKGAPGIKIDTSLYFISKHHEQQMRTH